MDCARVLWALEVISFTPFIVRLRHKWINIVAAILINTVRKAIGHFVMWGWVVIYDIQLRDDSIEFSSCSFFHYQIIWNFFQSLYIWPQTNLTNYTVLQHICRGLRQSSSRCKTVFDVIPGRIQIVHLSIAQQPTCSSCPHLSTFSLGVTNQTPLSLLLTSFSGPSLYFISNTLETRTPWKSPLICSRPEYVCSKV